MTLAEILTAFAAVEKRAFAMYLLFSRRYADGTAVPDLWKEMSNAEAGHAAILTLAADRAGLESDETPPPPDLLTDTENLLSRLEERARVESLPLAEAVEIALTWEEQELPRLLRLLRLLPPRIKVSLVSGMARGMKEHLGQIHALAALTNSPRGPAVQEGLWEVARQMVQGSP